MKMLNIITVSAKLQVPEVTICCGPSLPLKYYPRGVEGGDIHSFLITQAPHGLSKKLKLSHYTPRRRLRGRGNIAPTHSRPRH
jgi:hypothetical protein